MASKPTYEELARRVLELEARIEDIDDQKTARRAENLPDDRAFGYFPDDMREPKDMFQLVIDNIPQYIFWKDLNSVFLGCNQNFAQAAGVEDPESIRGKNDYDLAWKKEEADFFRKCDRQVMENDTPEFNIIEPQLQASGRQSWLNTNKIPLHDRKGRVVGILGTFEDVTDRINTQKTLRYYEKILATTNDMMSIIDTDFVYQAVNDAYLEAHQKDRKEIVGHSVKDLMGEEVFNRLSKPHLKRAIAGEVIVFNDWFDYPAHGKRYMHVSYYPYYNDQHELEGVVVNARDMTRVKRLEYRLLQSQKMEAIGTLAGGIAHDFNNILGGIMGYAELARVFNEDREKVDNYVDQILSASQRAKELVRQILDFSRQSNAKKVPMSVGLVVKEALKLMRASLPSTIQLTQSIPSDLGVVMANQVQIHQVVMNLCTNAYQAMEKNGGRLIVDLFNVDIGDSDMAAYPSVAPGKYLKLVVSDSGHGMDADTVTRIFDPYYTTKGTGEGTGMGLATVYGIVKNHGGFIHAYSEPGVGTSFHVLLPQLEGFAEKEEEVTVSIPLGDERILLVDDELPILDTTKQFLQHAGYDVDAKSCPVDALDVFRSQPDIYDLVITDMTMPNMTGDTLAQKLKETRSDIPVILCSGFSKQLVHRNILEMGVNGILMKPVTLNTLAEEARKVLDNQSIS